MSNDKPNHDPSHTPNGELLSAYLDGELSDAERAAVEARLASDPEAQHLLHQLRAVSQAVQAMPLKAAGHDLHHRILSKIETAKPFAHAAAAPQSTVADVEEAPWMPGNTLPRVTAFQTRRSWIWASLVVAAALMIMVLQPGKEANQNLPAVAQNSGSRQSKEQAEESSQRSLSAPPQSGIDSATVAQSDSASSVSGMPVTEAPLAASAPAASKGEPFGQIASADRASGLPQSSAAPGSAEASGRLRDLNYQGAFNGGAIGGAGPSGAPSLGGQVGEAVIASNEPEERTDLRRNSTLGANDEAKVALGRGGSAARVKSETFGKAGPGGIGGRGGGSGAANGSPMPASDASEPLVQVVHVVAKRGAIQNKAFDQLLASNGIAFTPEPASTRASGKVERAAKQAEVDRVTDGLQKPAAEAAEQNQDRDVEVVLVEAPRSTILSFMSGLSKDSENYVGVEVDDTSEAQDRRNNQEDTAKKVATGLGQYSRGVVTPQQKDAFRNRYYAYTDRNGDQSKLDFDAKQDVVREPQPQSPETIARPSDASATQEKQKSSAARGRARRVESWELSANRSGSTGPGGMAPRSQDLAGAKLRRAESTDKSPADSENTTWQVLFVLSPDQEESTTAPASAAPVLKATK